jgi:fibronectin-binding autotransporter adhesin
MKPKSKLLRFLVLAASSLLAISSAHAAGPYYWDGNNDTSGFGTAGGTWADPTAGTLTSGWSTDSTGATAVDGNSVSTGTADSLNFGLNTTGNGLAAGTISVSGTVNAGSITFGNQNGAITLSGGTINLTAAGTITVGVNTTISSVISGAGTSFTKVGNSLLTLTGLNTYTGATFIGSSTSGVLEVTHIANGGLASGIGASSNAASNLVIAANNQGVLRYSGTTNASTDRNFTIGNTASYYGGFESSGAGTLTLTSTSAVSYITTNSARFFLLGGSNTGQNTLNAKLVDNGSGALTFQKNGAGTWVLANETSSYTGSTTINGGVLSVSKMADYGIDSSIGKGTAGTAITFDSSGALLYTGSGDDTNRLVRTARDGTILNNGTGALNFTATGNFNLQVSQSLNRGLTFGGTNGGTISGAIQNNTGGAAALNLTKIGSGTWTLGGTNTYTGNTDVNAGTLRLQSGATTITQTLGALRSQLADGTLNSNKSGAGSITTTFSSYTRSAGATGNIVSTGGANGTDNSVNITGAAGFINSGLYFGGSEYAARSAASGFVRALAYGTDPSTVAANTVTANNHVKLTTTSYSGAGMTLLSLNLQGSGVNWTNTSGNLTTPGILKSGGGSQSTVSGGNVATPSNGELVIRTDTSSDSLLISSNLTHGGGALTKSGAGTLTLSGTNTFTGQTHVNAGTLSIGANVNLGSQTTGATLNLKGGTLQATGTFGLYNGTAGSNNRAVTLLDQSSIEVTGSNTLTIAGVISNHASAGVTTPGFNKAGTGALLLSGANTYTGATTVTTGTLIVNGNISTSMLTTVNAGATLGGSGTVGAATINGLLAPGNSIGTLNATGDVTWNDNDAWLFELGSAASTLALANTTPGLSDLLNITGGNDFLKGTGSSFTFDFAGGGMTGWYKLVDWTGTSDFVASNFFATNLDTGLTGTFTVDSSTSALYLNVVPEPRAALLGGLGLLALLRRRRA